jgi:hypothetical protein
MPVEGCVPERPNALDVAVLPVAPVVPGDTTWPPGRAALPTCPPATPALA